MKISRTWVNQTCGNMATSPSGIAGTWYNDVKFPYHCHDFDFYMEHLNNFSVSYIICQISNIQPKTNCVFGHFYLKYYVYHHFWTEYAIYFQ